jgi:hypothetical protein
MPKTSGTRAFNDANCSGITNRFGTEDVACVIDKHLVLIQEESVILRVAR